MRSALVATTCALALTASVGLSACGGGNDPTDKIPTTAPALVPPDDANDLASGGHRDEHHDEHDRNHDHRHDRRHRHDERHRRNHGHGGGDRHGNATGGTGTDTGGTGTGTGGNTNTTTTPNPGGVTPDATAGAGSFQGFCDSNPGAC